jgi:gliding motility-associated-like protein
MDTKRLQLRNFLFFLIVFASLTVRSYAQYEVYANQLIDSTTDFHNASRAVDANQTNYAYISNTLGVLATSRLRVRFPEWGNAGDVVNFTVQGSNGLLGLSLLDDITIKLYDSAGTTPVATLTGSSTLKLSLLTPGTNIYNVQFITNPSSGIKFKEASIELSGVVSVSLTDFRVYGAYFQRPCPPVYADNVLASGSMGILSLGSVDNAGRVVDANPDNYATMNTLISILGLGSSYIDVTFPRYAKAGNYVGFTVANTSGLLSTDVLGGLTIITYDETGAVKETKSGSSLLNLALLSGTTDRYSAGFVTSSGTYRISKLRIVKNAVVGLLSSIKVYNAFYYSINRPPVTVTTSGPTTFCAGGSVTLTAFDSLGATNYTWSTGATTAAITVNTSGTYYVEVIDSFSCVRRSIPVGVQVNANPVPTIYGDSVLCLGLSGALNISGGSFVSQVWNTGATTTGISSVGTGKYYVRVTDANACSGSDTINVIQNKLNVVASITPSTCSNTSTGAISLTVSGGSGSYSYVWSNGSTSSSITAQKEGLYTCIVKDNIYGCSYNKSFSITSSNTLSAKLAVVNTSACAKTDGSVNLTVVGGSGTYSYLWSNGATSSGLSTVGAGIYKVTITDGSSGCKLDDTVAVGDGGNNLVLTPSITNSSSCSTPNGAISLAVSGGSGIYTYAWSTGATSSSITGLKAGTYYVVVKDVTASCSKASILTVNNNGSMTINAAVVKPGCKKQNGSITVSSVSGGTGPYSYSWNTGLTTTSISGLQAGTYILTVSDAGSGCTKQQVYTLADSTGPSASLAITQPDCGANSNGAITVTATGTNNVYSWSNGANTKSITSLKPGTYTLTVADTSTGCSSVYQATLTINNQMVIVASPANNTSCTTAPDGAVSVSVFGGTTPFTYSWSSGETAKDLLTKNAGTYNLTITDANGCVAAISVPVKTDSTKLLNAAISSIVKATCNTAANGSAYVTVGGGKTPYNYSWSPSGAVTKDLVNVVYGSYILTVTDAVGCSKQVNANITIDSSVALSGRIDSTKASGCASSATGAVFVSLTGGAVPYTYQWKKGTTVIASTKNISSVAAGSYTLTVTDNNGCTLVLNATVPVLSTGVVVVLDSVTRPTCNVSADGKVYASVSGGLAPYTYSWSTGAITEDLINANPGTLILTATDANGCPGQLIVNLTYDTSKTLVVIADSTTGAGCAVGRSGALFITASKGTTPYTYLWSNGSIMSDLISVTPGTYSVVVTDSRGCKANIAGLVGIDTARSIKGIIDSVQGAGCIGSKSGKIFVSTSRGVAPYSYSWSNGETTEDILDAAPGVYSVIISDAAGCSQTLISSVGVDTAKKIVINVDSVKGASCSLGANGSIFVHLKGGKAPYVYSWSNGATTASLMNVIPGFYTLTVLDANGCSGALSATIGVDTARAIKINGVSIKDAGCTGSPSGVINVAVSGGVAPYNYMWSNGATTRDITGIVPGSYTLTVKDGVGCSETYNANVKIDTSNAIKIVATSITDAQCKGSSSGSVTVNVTRGVPPYTYSWSNGALTKDLSFVPAGSYLLNVTDAIGCTAQLSLNIGINNSNPVLVKLDSVRAVGCLDTLSGAVYVSVSGGSSPYSYLWTNGAITQDIIGVAKGAYLLNVTDDAGCTNNLNANVGLATPVVASADVNSVTCNGGSDGSITVTATGGSGHYAYKWVDGLTSTTRTGLAAGSYAIKVTDIISGCADTNTYSVTQADSLKIDATVIKDTCLPGYDGKISLSVTGGVSPYTYSWSNGANGDQIINLAPQNYTVTVTDTKGCTMMKAYTVGETDCDFRLNIHDVITPNGDGKNDAWVIEGIEYYANSMLQVVDKWGDLVYERRHYDNTFNGVNSKTGAVLPSGTYYYILRLNEPNKAGGADTFKGALLIQR